MDKEIRDSLLDLGMKPKFTDINQADDDGFTPAHDAALHNNLPLMTELAKLGANFNLTDHGGHTAAHYAAINGYAQVMDVLLHHNADPNITDDDGFTPADLAAEEGHIDVIILLGKHHANLDTIDDKIHSAVRLASQLNESEAKLDQSDTDYWTTIYTAPESAAMDILSNENTQELDEELKNGDTVAHIAAREGNLDVINMLAVFGKDLNTTNKNGDTPAHTAVEFGQPEMIACLAKNKAELSAANDLGLTPAHYAAIVGDANMMAALIKHGANISKVDDHGNTPESIAKKENYMDVISVLNEKKTHVAGKTSPTNITHDFEVYLNKNVETTDFHKKSINNIKSQKNEHSRDKSEISPGPLKK